MNIATLNTGLRAAIKDAKGIVNAWVWSKYGKEHTFASRIDSRAFPSEEDCPWCALNPEGKMMSHDSLEHFNIFTLDLAVSDESENGFDTLENYRIKLQTCMETYAQSLNLQMIEIEVNYNIIDHYPILLSGMQIKFLENKVINGTINPIT